jgi:hypothetical protein
MTNLLYQVRELPVFQNRMYDTEDEAKACPKGDVQLVQNLDTGLIYNEAFCPELMRYDVNYQNEQALSAIFQDHLKFVTSIIEDHIGKKDLIEVGCGKGFFLERLLEKGFQVRGFDPTYEGSNKNIERKYFTSNVGIKGEGIILRHVLEHIQNPIDFLFQLKESNGGKGKVYIEVPCFDWICQNRAWFDIFYEHVNYFRLSDFHRIFGNVLKSDRFFGGQYIYVVAELDSLQVPKINGDKINFPSDFLDKLKKQKFYKGNQKIAIWGGASKGVIFSLLMSRLGHLVDVVVDINPAKQGKYLPATGLLVSPPTRIFDILPCGSQLFVMNSNYMEEIKQMSNNLYQYIGIDNV